MFLKRKPLVCFCTTTNVQDKKTVSLEDYVDLRNITAKKVLEAIINKNLVPKPPQLTHVYKIVFALLRLLV